MINYDLFYGLGCALNSPIDYLGEGAFDDS